MKTRARPGCGHDHSGDVVAELACKSRLTLFDMVGGRLPVIVAIGRPEGDDVAVSMAANHGNAAQIVLGVCDTALKQPRSTDCPACQEAHDRLSQVAAILRAPMARC